MNRVFSHIFVYFLKYLGSETDMEMESHPENANHIFFFFRTQSTNARTMEIVLDKKNSTCCHHFDVHSKKRKILARNNTKSFGLFCFK